MLHKEVMNQKMGYFFPYIKAEKSFMHFRNSLIECDFLIVFLNQKNSIPSNSMNEIVDEAIYKGGNWFIYGSGKPNEESYKLTKIYKYSVNSISNFNNFTLKIH